MNAAKTMNAYSALLYIIHLTFNLALKICTLASNLKLKFQRLNVKDLNKLPKHLAIVVGSDNLNVEDIVPVATWSVLLGIPLTSLYDSKGLLKKNESKLLNSICDNIKKSKQLCSNFNDSISGSLVILHPEDSKKALLSTASDICSLISKQQLTAVQITIDYVDQFIKTTSKLEDVDLLISFGSSNCLLGYPPWQLRLTEIFNSGSLKNFSYKEFFSILFSFSKVQQRCGR